MNSSAERKTFAWLAGIFLVAYFLPLEDTRFEKAILEAFRLLQWYAREHTLACVVPAMFIAGAISTFLSQASVLNYLGPDANRIVAYTVGAVSGFILAVCSCSVLPMFAGIYTLGAGLGPACAFLYSGPAINVMAVFLSARVLGLDIGVARAVGSITFAYVLGLAMAVMFRREETRRKLALAQLPPPPPCPRSLFQTTAFFVAMLLFLIFSDWFNTNAVTIRLTDGTTLRANVAVKTRDMVEVKLYEPSGKLAPSPRRIKTSQIREIEPVPSFAMTVHGVKWYLAGLMGLIVALMCWRWFSREELADWMRATWDFGRMIVPLLFGGVFLTGFVGALIPQEYVATLVGGNGLFANVIASFIGAIWYFATLTEIPIVEVLMRLGMGKGPALALLLAGPALSLPSILVIHRILGFEKTVAFCTLTVLLSALVGLAFGAFAG
ncbi:MAG: permease [Candidatus Riflebacteria bacterium]|nr:permease [Candidatus Riflebacteria bacterium]